MFQLIIEITDHDCAGARVQVLKATVHCRHLVQKDRVHKDLAQDQVHRATVQHRPQVPGVHISGLPVPLPRGLEVATLEVHCLEKATAPCGCQQTTHRDTCHRCTVSLARLHHHPPHDDAFLTISTQCCTLCCMNYYLLVCCYFQ